MAEFRVYKRGEKIPQKSLSRAEVRDRIHEFYDKATKGAAYLRHNEAKKRFQSVKLAKARALAITARGSGRAVRLERRGINPEADKVTLVIQQVERETAVVDLGCHPEIEKAHALLWAEFGEENLRSAGRWYCRLVAGTLRTVSRHGYLGKLWKGAAEDVFGEGSMNTMAGLEKIAKFLVAKHNQGKVELYTVIYGDKRWRAGEGWGDYDGDFHTHVHYDALGGQPCKP